MDCPNCRAPYDKTKRFCTVCGTALGMLCQRCGAVSGNEDSYCGNCGLPLLDSDNDKFQRGASRQNLPRQYDATEILTLLSLRMTVEDGKAASKTYTQNDIDRLFE